MGKNDNDEHVILAYYAGAYGAMIRIDIPSRNLLNKIKGIFEDLVSKQIGEINLRSLPYVKCFNLGELILRADESHPKSFEAKTLSLVNKRLGQARFAWIRTAEGWKECWEKLEALRAPGHQYLTIEGLDDALVEASFGETSIEIRSAILSGARNLVPP